MNSLAFVLYTTYFGKTMKYIYLELGLFITLFVTNFKLSLYIALLISNYISLE